MPYLIDGHNLIARLPDIALDDPHDEAKLVLRLRGFAARTGKQCIVVFDKGLPGGPSSLSTPSVKVIFAIASHTTADRIIQERIRHTPDAGNWTVVSSDNEVLEAARRHGLKTMTCAEFAARLIQVKTPVDRSEAAHVIVPEQEVAEWLEKFSAAPEIDSPPESGVDPAGHPENGRNGHATSPAPQKPGSPKDSRHRPLSTAGKYDDDIFISDEDIETWLSLFNSAPPVPQTRPPQKPRPRPPVSARPENDESDIPTSSPPARPRTPEPPPLSPGKFDEGHISAAEVEEWLRIFGENDNED